MMVHAGRGAEPDLVIESPANQQVKDLVALQTKRRQRAERGRVVVEGHDEVALVVGALDWIETLYCCPSLWRSPDDELVASARGADARVVELSERAFAKAAYRERPDGWLAVVADPVRPLSDVELGASALVLVCEGVEKPGNLGAMLRTADAVGVDACVAVSPGTDWGNPNVVRASKGTVFTVPVVSATEDEWFHWVDEQELRVVAATPAATVDFTDADFTGRVAVAVGTEREGLTDRWLASAEVAVRIPMVGAVNSLNVAMSAGLLLYEARRQRRLVDGVH